MKLEGVFPILPTPFHDDETFDRESMTAVVRFMRELGVDGITVLGVLGEASRLSDGERELVIRTAVQAADGLPVIVGASAGATYTARELAKMAQCSGACAVMVTPHAEAVPSDERIVEYYRGIADAISIPIVLQDHPASTQVHMSAALIARITAEVPAIAGIKEEAVPTAPKIRQLRGLLKRPLKILTGLGGLYALFDLEAGSDGFNTGFAFPEALMAMHRASRAQDWVRVRSIYRRFLPLIVFEQQPGVAIRKEVFRLRGLIKTGRVRHPGAGISPETSAQLRALLDETLPGVDLARPITVE
ncbi:MAG TPA: dihydrodipicolinate synthase family protein [Burkholderiales bacterium]|nr:dihydrodipicolinate synthase family protein [Burkholderiales bacterium]